MSLRILTIGIAILGLLLYTFGALLDRNTTPRAARSEILPANYTISGYYPPDPELSLLVVRLESEQDSYIPEPRLTPGNSWLAQFAVAPASTLSAPQRSRALNCESTNPIQEEGRK